MTAEELSSINALAVSSRLTFANYVRQELGLEIFFVENRGRPKKKRMVQAQLFGTDSPDSPESLAKTRSEPRVVAASASGR